MKLSLEKQKTFKYDVSRLFRVFRADRDCAVLDQSQWLETKNLFELCQFRLLRLVGDDTVAVGG